MATWVYMIVLILEMEAFNIHNPND